MVSHNMTPIPLFLPYLFILSPRTPGDMTHLKYVGYAYLKISDKITNVKQFITQISYLWPGRFNKSKIIIQSGNQITCTNHYWFTVKQLNKLRQ